MLKQPVSIVNYTNVAIVKLKVNKDKFEVACYKNKIKQYREKIETDINEVLQVSEIFTNAVKGDKANKKELAKHFPKMTNEEIIDLILMKGDIQVSDKERETLLGSVKNDIASIICEKTFDLQSGKPFSQNIILKALQDIGASIKEHEDPKKQALKFIKLIQDSNILTIERRYMKLAISLKRHDIKYKDIKEFTDYLELHKAIVPEKNDSQFEEIISEIENLNIKEEISIKETNIPDLEENLNKISKEVEKTMPSKLSDQLMNEEVYKKFSNSKLFRLVSPSLYRDILEKFEESKIKA